LARLPLLALLSCVVGDAPCPSVGERFDLSEFGIGPEDDYGSAGCVPLGEMVEIPNDDWLLVRCTEAWCLSGYDGEYCVSREAIVEWLEGHDVDYQCRGTLQVCYVGCEECGGWCD
jgi:hypothetical protein